MKLAGDEVIKLFGTGGKDEGQAVDDGVGQALGRCR